MNESVKNATPVLEVKNLSVNYGVIGALHDISFSIQRGDIVTDIGANGAGKTTTLRAILGLAKTAAGEVLYEGWPITNAKAHRLILHAIVAGRGEAERPERQVRVVSGERPVRRWHEPDMQHDERRARRREIGMLVPGRIPVERRWT